MAFSETYGKARSITYIMAVSIQGMVYNLKKKKDHFFEQDFLNFSIIKSKKIVDGMKALVKSFNLRPISFL